MRDDFLWTELYRPKTIEETILPADLKATFQKFVDGGKHSKHATQWWTRCW
jgi:hypothetical protein